MLLLTVLIAVVFALRGEPSHNGKEPSAASPRAEDRAAQLPTADQAPPPPPRPVSEMRQPQAVVATLVVGPPAGPNIIVLDRNGISQGTFRTMEAALERATSGESIEIRSDDPIALGPVCLRAKALTIRAAAGSRPRLRAAFPGASAAKALVQTETPLTLEGLDIECRPPAGRGGEPLPFLSARGAVVRIANCRLIQCCKGPILQLEDVPRCVLRNSLLHCEQVAAVDCLAHSRSEVRAENCVFSGFSGIAMRKPPAASAESSLELHHSTFVLQEALRFHFGRGVRKPVKTDRPTLLRIAVTDDLFDTAGSLLTLQMDLATVEEVDRIVRRSRNDISERPALAQRGSSARGPSPASPESKRRLSGRASETSTAVPAPCSPSLPAKAHNIWPAWPFLVISANGVSFGESRCRESSH